MKSLTNFATANPESCLQGFGLQGYPVVFWGFAHDKYFQLGLADLEYLHMRKLAFDDVTQMLEFLDVPFLGLAMPLLFLTELAEEALNFSSATGTSIG